MAHLFLPDHMREEYRKLVELLRHLGRDPTFDEVCNNPNLIHPNDFAYYFGSFTKAIKEAHRVAFLYKEEPEWMKPNKTTIQLEEEPSMTKKYTIEQLCESLWRFYDENGYYPNSQEVAKCDYCASVMTYLTRFNAKTWEDVRIFAEERRKSELFSAETPKKLRDFTEKQNNSSPNAETEESAEEGHEIPKKQQEPERPIIPIKRVARAPKVGSYSPIISGAEGVAESILGPESEDPTPEPTEPTKAKEPEQINFELSTSEIMPPEQIKEDNAIIYSLIPSITIRGIRISGYASVLRMHDSLQTFRSIDGIPVLREFENLKILQNNKLIDFPEPQEGILYLVERQVANTAKLNGRSTKDLLIPKKFTREGSTMTIQELTTI